MKKEDNKRKKRRCDNVGDNEKEQLRKYEKKGKTIEGKGNKEKRKA